MFVSIAQRPRHGMAILGTPVRISWAWLIVTVVIAHDVQLSSSHIVVSGLLELVGPCRLPRRAVFSRHLDPPFLPLAGGLTA